MAIRISQLPEAFNLSLDEDIFPILQNDITKKARLNLIKIPEYTSVYNFVNSNSSTYQENFTVLQTSSAKWDEYYDSVSLFVPLTGENLEINLSNTNFNLSGNLNLDGNFEVGSGDQSSFYIGEDGKVGIYTETPNETLTVVGNISSDVLYAKNGNSDVWNETSQRLASIPEGITSTKSFVDYEGITNIITLVKGIIVSWDQFIETSMFTWNDNQNWNDNLIWNETV
jgi:hypothetical protein